MTLETTRDAFLGGRLHLLQPRHGYRAGVDPVLLAAAVNARAGQTVLDLGCGVGTAALCLHARIAGLEMTGVEKQADYADLAMANGQDARAKFDVVTADLRSLPVALRQSQFDHVLTNPPYFKRDTGHTADDQGRAAGRAEDTDLADWIDVAVRRLAPQGYLHVIQRADRLPDLLGLVSERLGSIEVLPIAARTHRAAHLIILRARKSGRAPFRLHAPFILHDGDRHVADAESYRAEVSDILRNAAPLNWPEAASK